MAENLLLITIIAIVVVAVIVGGWVDLAYLGLAVRAWGFGPARALPPRGAKPVIWHRFGKTGPLIGWLFSPSEVIVTSSRLLVNYRNAFNRLDIPLDSIRTVSVRRRPWPMLDDILIGYSASGTPRQFLLSDNARPIVTALEEAGARFESV